MLSLYNFFRLLPFLCCFFSIPLFSSPYNLAACTMFKNESRWIREWVEYHHLLGVEHFYLYNNESSDETLNILQPYIENGLVEVIPWENNPTHWDPRGTNFDGYQIKAFNDCIQRSIGRTKWLAILDIDEYIVPVLKDGEFLTSLLNQEYSTHTGSLVIHWQIFGTSGIWEIPSNKLMTELLVWRAEDHHPWHQLTKCIHRPEAIADCTVHSASLKPGYVAKDLNPSFIRINHYWSRDEKCYLNKRFGLSCESSPQNLCEITPQNCQHIQELLEGFHHTEDSAIFPMLKPLIERMFGKLASGK
jgi:hypothetical protein